MDFGFGFGFGFAFGFEFMALSFDSGRGLLLSDAAVGIVLLAVGGTQHLVLSTPRVTVLPLPSLPLSLTLSLSLSLSRHCNS